MIPRVVDEDVEIPAPGSAELADRRQASEIELPDLGVAGHRGGGGLAFRDVAHSEHHARAHPGQLARCHLADSARGAGHDHGATGHVG
jgi:hypothetical protein